MRLSFRFRFILASLAVFILLILVPSFWYKQVLHTGLVIEEKEQARKLLDHVKWLLRRDVNRAAENLQDRIKEVGTSLGVRITLINQDGVVQADSELSREQVRNLSSYALRPEVLQAKREGTGTNIRKSETRAGQPLFLYMAGEVEDLWFVKKGYLRIMMPHAPVQNRLNQYTGYLFVLAGLGVLLSIAGGYLLAGQLRNSLNIMKQAADAIGKGRFRERIWVVPGKEFEPLASSINTMAENIEHQIRTITEQKGQIEAVLNGIREGVAVLDEQCIIKDGNESLKRIFSGLTEIRGLRPLELVRNTVLHEACGKVIQAREEGIFSRANLQMELDGDRYYDVSIVPLEKENISLAAVMVFHNITELKRLEKVRRDFVANVSHELRTPLTSIKGYAETLMSSEDMDTETRQSFFKVIIKNANNMSNLVQDLLQLAKLESSKSRKDWVQSQPSEVLQDAWRACFPLAEEKNVELENQLSAEGILVQIDQEQLTQVFRNLLENAIKYSPDGGKVVAFSSVEQDMITIGIKDSGIGVPEADRKRIFERFYRVEKHRAKDMPGTGLGLAICRHIIQNVGGEIWVESPPRGEARGAVFFFSLPLAND